MMLLVSWGLNLVISKQLCLADYTRSDPRKIRGLKNQLTLRYIPHEAHTLTLQQSNILHSSKHIHQRIFSSRKCRTFDHRSYNQKYYS